MAGISDLILSSTSKVPVPGKDIAQCIFYLERVLDISKVLDNALHMRYVSENLLLHALHSPIHFSVFVRTIFSDQGQRSPQIFGTSPGSHFRQQHCAHS